MTIVIVGGGQAGGQAAASLRQAGYDGRLVLLAEEQHIPYQRPPLSKGYLAGQQGLDRVYLRPHGFYQAKDVEVRTGERVERLDIAAKKVVCASGDTLGYDKLLLATGARPRHLDVPGAALHGVHCLRSIADADAIRADWPPGSRVVIVGGGYIGLEVAAVAVTLGLEVTVLEMEERILGRVASPEMSRFYQRLHTGKGVAIRTGARACGFVGDGRLQAVACADGRRFPADVAIVGVGVVPNVELAAAAGLACDDGIVVDERARTEAPDVYAAGDCTKHPNALLGRRLRLESVPNAMEQARVAAANLVAPDGAAKTYNAVPWFWSDQYDLKLQMVGFAADGDASVTRGAPCSGQFATFHLRGEELVAADAVNSPREFMAARQLIGRKVVPRLLADPATDIRAAVDGFASTRPGPSTPRRNP